MFGYINRVFLNKTEKWWFKFKFSEKLPMSSISMQRMLLFTFAVKFCLVLLGIGILCLIHFDALECIVAPQCNLCNPNAEPSNENAQSLRWNARFINQMIGLLLLLFFFLSVLGVFRTFIDISILVYIQQFDLILLLTVSRECTLDFVSFIYAHKSLTLHA